MLFRWEKFSDSNGTAVWRQPAMYIGLTWQKYYKIIFFGYTLKRKKKKIKSEGFFWWLRIVSKMTF